MRAYAPSCARIPHPVAARIAAAGLLASRRPPGGGVAARPASAELHSRRGVALFGGASFADRRAAFLAPLGAMFTSDLALGVHVLLPVVYACFAFNVVLGWWLRQRHRPLPIAAATLISSCVFFVVTNAACWALWYRFRHEERWEYADPAVPRRVEEFG